MIIDNFQVLSGTSNGATGGITASAQGDSPTTGTQVTSNVIDYGVTTGIPNSAGGGGARDMGIGDDPSLKVVALVTTAFTVGTSLQLLIAGAPDNGSGAPGSYTTLWTSPVIAEANLIAGARIGNVDFPRAIPGVGPARFIRGSYVSVGTHSTGVIEFFIGLDEFEQVLGSGGAISGYPAGINIAN
jgi:hypothetical protein